MSLLSLSGALPRRSSTQQALSGLGVRTIPLEASASQRLVEKAAGWLERRTSRRGFLVGAGVVGSALAVDPFGFVLTPGTAYASVCGPGSACSTGWTVFCATINKGVNACPPGSIAAGWWKADGASLCGGKARYIIDCNSTCSRCSSPGTRAGICASDCWSCSCTCGPQSSCDRRKVCCNSFRYGQCNTQVRQVGGIQCRVVSCTPPYVFENCSTGLLVDNRTSEHSSSELPTVWNAISARYQQLGENGSILGATVYGQVTVPGAIAQRYQNGQILQTPQGVFEVVGPIEKRWVALGGATGILGLPITGWFDAPDGGRATRFALGRISSRPTTGTWETVGEVAATFERLGSEGGPLGYPTSGDTATPGGGHAGSFTGGRISSSGAGTYAVLGDVATKYRRLGLEGGRLGPPTSDTASNDGGAGVFTRFERGRICSRRGPGTHWMGLEIAEAYRVRGSEPGPLGYPTGDQVERDGLLVVTFENATLTYDPATGQSTQGPVQEPPIEPVPPGKRRIADVPLRPRVSGPG